MAAPHEPSGPETPKAANSTGPVSSGWISSGTFGGESHVQGKRAAGATVASVAFHGLLLALIVAFFTIAPQQIVPTEPMELPRLVFLQQPGPGGGGGGSPAPAPPKPVEIPRSKPPAPVPVVPPPPVPPPPIPPPTLVAPIMTRDSNLAQATGASSVSLANYGGGGQGTGLGTGRGSGVGPGEGGGFGGGAFRLGSGITNPTLIKQTNPAYTSDAMRSKITGIVVLEAVVLADGTVGDVRVLKSLDRGLDQEAIKAAKMWLFTPARDREGKPVPVIASLELTFRLH
jgi:periplasmic protein TonB